MAIVPGIDEVSDPTGAQSIVTGEPAAEGTLPSAEMPPLPSAELGVTTAAQADSGTAMPSMPSMPTSGASGSSALRDKIISMGMQYIGTPYLWGGTRPGGFDCSGLMQYIFGRNGIALPRVSYQQANFGKRIGLNALQAGDLVAWDDSSRNSGADHIALYIGNGQILEAPHTGATVRVRTLTPGKGFDASAWGVSLNLPGDQ